MKGNKAKSKKINAFDLVIVLILAVVILFAIWRFQGNSGNQKIVQDNIMISIEAKENDPEILAFIEEGDMVYDGVSKQALGTIAAVHEKPSYQLVENHQAKAIEMTEIPNKIDVVIEVTGKANLEHPDVVINTIPIKVGKQLDCIVGKAVMKGTIIQMDYTEMPQITKGGAEG